MIVSSTFGVSWIGRRWIEMRPASTIMITPTAIVTGCSITKRNGPFIRRRLPHRWLKRLSGQASAARPFQLVARARSDKAVHFLR